MKINKLRLYNINSLEGRWEIDFTDRRYQDSGLFALTGPTGSGKSSVLDAVCLGLYGQTPRQGKLTQSGNEVMTRGTWECSAEVEFSIGNREYRSSWSQRRARKKADGKLQAAGWEIAEKNGEILAATIKEAEKKIVELTGMDFEQFTRSVLLAQGGFAAFLRARPEERGPILEKLTGTGIYSAISRKVHDNHRDVNDNVKEKKARLEGMEVAEPEELEKAAKKVKKLEKQQKQLNKDTGIIEKVARWRRELERLQAEQKQLQADQKELQQQQEQFTPQRKRLEQGRSADKLNAQWEKRNKAIEEKTRVSKELQQEKQEKPPLEEQLKESQENFDTKQNELTGFEKRRTAELETIRRVRKLDQEIAALRVKIESAEQSCSDLQEAKEDLEKQLTESAQQEKNAAEEKKTAEEELAGFSFSKKLPEKIALLQEKAKQISGAGEDIADTENKLAEQLPELNRQLQPFDITVALDKAAGVSSVKQLQKELDNRDQLLKTLQSEQETLQENERLQIANSNLEQFREQLQSGKPCPLCGALEHPWEQELPDQFKDDQLQKKIKENRQKIKKTNDELAQVRAVQPQLQQFCSLIDTLDKQQQHLQKLQQEFSKLAGEAEVELDPLAADALDELAALEQQTTRFKELNEKVKVLQNRLEYSAKQRAELQKSLQETAGKLQKKQEELKDLREKCAAQEQQRKDLYGEKDPDQEQQRLDRELKALQKSLEGCRSQYEEIKHQLEKLAGQIKFLSKELETRQAAAKFEDETWETLLDRSEFADQQAFLAARLADVQLQQLEQQAKALDQQETANRSGLERNSKNLAKQQENEPKESEQYPEEASELDGVIRQNREQLNNIAGELGSDKRWLEEQQKKQQQVEQLQKDISALEQDLNLWATLKELIGSGDGKKYRQFVQQLNFEQLIRNANRRLIQIYPRYLLKADETEELEFRVIDDYQGGTVRDTSNLSGGESFLVSLSLALALSDMAGGRAQVGTLFLDEGFGTLDAETLDAALDALAELQQTGKLIGIISHIPAIRERVQARIRVKRTATPGRSRLEGPGVRAGDRF